MKLLLIIISILLFSSPLFGNPKKWGTLYFWKTSSSLSWKEFIKIKINSKYQGDVVSVKPNGLGILTYPRGQSMLENRKTEDFGME